MKNERSLESRIADLERRCRRLQLLCIASSAGLVGACLASATAAPPTIVRAERFELVAPDGRPAGAWSADEKGALLEMTTASGERRLMLGAGEIPVTGTHLVPFAGLTVIGTEPEASEPTLVHVGTGLRGIPGFSVERGETTAWLQVRPESIALLHLEGAETAEMPFGALNAAAGAEGVILSTSWNDELSTVLGSTPERTGLSVHDESDAEEEDPPAAIELLLDAERAAGLRLRDGERVVFEAP